MKKFIWTVVMSLVFSSSFAEPPPVGTMSHGQDPDCCFEPSYEVPCGCLCAGYNHPAQINTHMLDAYINVSFLYWEARQDGMSLALTSTNSVSGPTNDPVVYQSFEYKPGAKVEAGFTSESWDDWGGLIEYTRMHGTYSDLHTVTDGQLIMSPWINRQGTNITADNIDSKWENALDVIDFGLFRNYYVGRHLTFMTYFGGRGGWLNQSLNFVVNVQSIPAGLSNPRRLENRSKSWFVGPRAAIRTNWILGWGFSLVGNTSASICYQGYQVNHNQDETNSASQTGISTSLETSQLRPFCDLQAGLRWGAYTCGQRFHFDLQATYDFMVYFSQNMMRVLADYTGTGTEASPGNLYFHGLSLKAQFNF